MVTKRTNRSRRATFGALLVTLACSLVGSGCEKVESAPLPNEREELVVSAAASLRESFSTLGDAFERTRPNAKTTFNFAGSQDLRSQIEHGAMVDVFASADQKHMTALLDAKKAARPTVFVRNEPVMIVSKDSAATLRAFADLPSAARVVIGVPEVPIGRYSLQILDKASKSLGSDFRSKVEARVVSRELNVRQVLSKVALGEADAAIVYKTDAAAGGERVVTVTIPPELNVVAEYPMAVLEDAPHPELARAWVAFVLSEQGRQILTNAGFVVPAPVAPSP